MLLNMSILRGSWLSLADIFLLCVAGLSLFLGIPVHAATTVYYQPTPYATSSPATSDGWLLKSFQTECNSSGNPIRYYLSSNRTY